MTTATQTTKPATKRTLRMLSAFAGTNRATIRIQTQRGNARPEVTDYSIEFTQADSEMGACGLVFSKVFEESKPRGMTSQQYCVLVGHDGQGKSCSCTGFIQHGACKHQGAVPTLLKLRKGD